MIMMMMSNESSFDQFLNWVRDQTLIKPKKAIHWIAIQLTESPAESGGMLLIGAASTKVE